MTSNAVKVVNDSDHQTIKNIVAVSHRTRFRAALHDTLLSSIARDAHDNDSIRLFSSRLWSYSALNLNCDMNQRDKELHPS